MAGISSKAAGGLENKRKYNGIEFENDLDLNTYDAFFRELDPQTGRWWQIDPKIEKMEAWSPYASNYDNPITYSDPLGDEPYEGPGDPPAKQGFFSKAWYNVVKPGMDWINANVNPVTPIVELVTGKDYNNGNFDIDKPRAQSTTEAAISILPGGKVAGAVVKTAEKVLVHQVEKTIIKTATETEVKGFTKHAVDRAIERNVKPVAILDAIKNPLKTGNVLIDKLDRPSQRYVGKTAEVVINPTTGKIISVNPTSTKKAEKLIKKLKE